jgi:hypothetical protein
MEPESVLSDLTNVRGSRTSESGMAVEDNCQEGFMNTSYSLGPVIGEGGFSQVRIARDMCFDTVRISPCQDIFLFGAEVFPSCEL